MPYTKIVNFILPGYTKIVNFILPGAGVLTLESGQNGHIVLIYKMFKNLLLLKLVAY